MTETDKQTHRLVANGHFQIVYATPEILLKRTSRFRNIVMTRNGNKFTSNVLAIAIDEAHIPSEWGSFRIEYQQLPILRDYFPTASVVALSATFSRRIKRHIIDTMSMTDLVLIERSIRRRNILKMVSPIRQPGYMALDILIPEGISHRNNIPTTLIYHDSIEGGRAIAQYLRKRLPSHLRQDGKEIVRIYAGYLADDVRSLYENDIQMGPTRILICTDACGMGIHLKGIVRVIQWKVTSNLGVEGIDQRFGRAGRDSSQRQTIAVAFVDPTLATPFFRLSGTSEPMTVGDENENENENEDEDEDQDKTSIRPPQRRKVSKIPPNLSDLLFRLITPVLPSNKAEVQSLLTEIANIGRASHSSHQYFHRTWYKQDVGGLWFINVVGGCRHKVLMALFDDPATFEEDFWDETQMCCDICVKAALDTGLLDQCPVVHGIPLSIGLAFYTEIPQPTVSTSTSAGGDSSEPLSHPICKTRIDKVKDAIRLWRTEIAKEIKPRVPPPMVLSEKAIGKIAKAVKSSVLTETLIRTTLEQSGINVKRSGISKHIPGLVEVITKCLFKSAMEQPQLPIPALPGRPLAPAALPFIRTSAQIEYDMLERQVAEIQEVNTAKENRKRKKQEEHSRRGKVIRTTQYNNMINIDSVVCFGDSQSLIIRAYLFPLLTKRTCRQWRNLKKRFRTSI